MSQSNLVSRGVLQGQDRMAATANFVEVTRVEACPPNQELCVPQCKHAACIAAGQTPHLHLSPSVSLKIDNRALHYGEASKTPVLFHDVQGSITALDPLPLLL